MFLCFYFCSLTSPCVPALSPAHPCSIPLLLHALHPHHAFTKPRPLLSTRKMHETDCQESLEFAQFALPSNGFVEQRLCNRIETCLGPSFPSPLPFITNVIMECLIGALVVDLLAWPTSYPQPVVPKPFCIHTQLLSSVLSHADP